MSKPIASGESAGQGFLDNSFYIFPLDGGAHRSGLDAMLVAVTVPVGTDGRIADFGAGTGAAGFAVAQRCGASRVDLFEIDPDAMEQMQAALEDQRNAHLTSRLQAHCLDVTAVDQLRAAIPSHIGDYDHVICNPPFNDAAHRSSPNAKKALAHQMGEWDFDRWIRSATSVLTGKGWLSLIFRPANLPEILQCLRSRFGAVHIKPVHPKSDQPANRLLLSAQKGSRAPIKFLPPLIIHQPDGAFTREAEEILRGRAGIDLN